MKKCTFLNLALLFIFVSCNQQKESAFDRYFSDKSLRIDYFHTGDAQTERVEIDEIYAYNDWAGSLTHLIDKIDYGAYMYKIYDRESEELIYSKGFDSYFKEYQLSDPAITGEERQFHETALIPFPKSQIIFVLEKRKSSGETIEVFREVINPGNAVEAPIDEDVQVFTSLDNGDPHVKADIAIIGEGYTTDEIQKFENDLKRFTEVFFRAEPCKSNKENFNVRGVFKPSQDSGVDEPRAGIDKNTAVSASFNTMGSERYVLVEDDKALHDIAGHAPYDALYIMVNHSRYGGGGIYNFYCVYTSDNIDSDYLMVHEFGHSFFGLADEYYTSSTAYNDFYTTDYEPNEPNITALHDPDNVKWQHLISEDIEIPTPWAKEKYDSLDYIWQKRRSAINDSIAELQKSGAGESAVANAKAYYDSLSVKRNNEVQAYLEGSPYAGKVGAFEGAGYMSTGLYRPSINCIMFTRTDYFCPVCQDAMQNVISTYTE